MKAALRLHRMVACAWPLHAARNVAASGSPSAVRRPVQDVEQRLLPGLRFAACCDSLDRSFAAGMQGCGVDSRRPAFAELHEQRPVQRTGSAADLHHQCFTDAGKQCSRVAGCQRIELGQHGFETALHVQTMVTVTDRLVELRQFIGVRDNATSQRFNDGAGHYCVHANVVSLQCGVLVRRSKAVR
jgi:hypothetical protein